MKKIVILLTLMAGFVLPAQAQAPTQRMKAIHMAAVRIADSIGIQEPERTAFVQIYQEFKKECAAIVAEKPDGTGDAEKDIEAKIYSDFEKSEKVLALRKSFYEKFRSILLPSQIQAMYDLEKEFNARK